MNPPGHAANSAVIDESGGIGNTSQPQQRCESLLSMRKHRSLDSSQFMSQFDNLPTTNYSAGKLSVPSSSAQFSYNQTFSADYDPHYFSSVKSAVPASNGFSTYYDSYYSAQQPHQQQHQHSYSTYGNFTPYYPDSQNPNCLFQQPKSYESGYLPSSGGFSPPEMNTIPSYENGILNEGTNNTLADSTANAHRKDHQPHSLPTQFYQPYVPPGSDLAKSFTTNYPSAAMASTNDYDMLKREFVTMNQKLSYVMNSIRTFWSPELKKERQLRKEEALRINALQYKLSQQASEVQRVRNELEKREKDIGQLLSESDLGEMEQELRRLRKQIRFGSGEPPPRDFTDKTPTMHELQTAKAKMERSELTLAEKSRELQNCEMRLKCAEEQNAELDKRAEILARTNAANEAQLKLLHDDLDVLRRKLETKNQQLESREKSIKNVEKELELTKTQLQQHLRTIQENEHQISQLTHRIDQLETLLRDRDSLVDRLKQRLIQSPDTRAEAELQQRLENAEKDKSALQAAIDTLRQSSDVEKQNQLQAFQEEARQLRSTIEYLQKELSDRHILIVSQNEKISQLDAELGPKLATSLTYFSTASPFKDDDHSSARTFGDVSAAVESSKTEERPLASTLVSVSTTALNTSQNALTASARPISATAVSSQNDAMNELEEARNEVGRLLSIVHQLEKEKQVLCSRVNNSNNVTTTSTARTLTGGTDISTTLSNITIDTNAILAQRQGRESDGVSNSMQTFTSTSSPTRSSKTENSALKLRIEALEEALRESVGITSERDRIINEQKQLVQQLSNQVTELHKNCGGRDLQKLLQNALGRAENAEKALRDDRDQFQKQLSSLRKEVAMAVIREKDACIQLLQGPPDSLREKVEILIRQREQLKHRLLTTTRISTTLPSINAGTTSVQESFGDLAADLSGFYKNSLSGAPTKAASALELSDGSNSHYQAEGHLYRQQIPATALYGLMNQPNRQQYSHTVPPPPTYTASSIVPINISVPPFAASNVGFSAPASLNYGRDQNFDDDGIWA